MGGEKDRDGRRSITGKANSGGEDGRMGEEGGWGWKFLVCRGYVDYHKFQLLYSVVQLYGAVSLPLFLFLPHPLLSFPLSLYTPLRYYYGGYLLTAQPASKLAGGQGGKEERTADSRHTHRCHHHHYRRYHLPPPPLTRPR